MDADILTKLSGKEGIPKFSGTCRVCLCEIKQSDQQLDTRIILLNNAQDIRSLLEESTGIQLVNYDFLPNHICERCFRTLTAFYKFRSQTQRSNEILNKYLRKLSDSLDSKSLPSTDFTIHMQGENLDVVSNETISQIQDIQIPIVKDKPEVVGFVFHCDDCTMTFNNHESLDKHQEEHSRSSKQQKTFKCKHCPKSFAFRHRMQNHMKLSHLHWQRYKFQCDVCERHFNNPNGLKMHKSKPCVSVDLIEQCKTQKLNVRKKELKAIADKIIRETKISCILCKENFRTQDDFIGHYPKHGKGKKCLICHKDFSSVKDLEKHVRKHLRSKAYACPMCSSSFYTSQQFRAHMREHGKRQWVYKCKVCEEEFFILRHFDRHMVKHLEDEKKALEKAKHNDLADILKIEDVNNIEIRNECDSDTSSEFDSENESNNQIKTDIFQDRLEFVKEEEIAERDSSVKEDRDAFIETESILHSTYKLDPEMSIDHECSNPANQLEDVDNININSTEIKTEISDLKDIVKLEKPELDNPSSEEENLEDSIDEISNLSKSNDQISKNQPPEHIQKILDKCIINCHVAGCQTKCSNLTQIWKHFREEHLSRKKPFKCSVCLEEFELKMSIRLHIKKYYSFKCPVCSKLKPNIFELKRHIILIHSNERPFKCLKCAKTFRSLHYLKSHEISHNNQKEFICSICSKDFFSINGLRLHINSHKDIKELQCSICNRQFLKLYSLKRHIDNKSCIRNRKKQDL